MALPSQTADPVLGERFEEALAFTVRLHRLQARKGGRIPYVGHLLGVCSLVIEAGGNEDMAIAALLHDAIEDQIVARPDIREEIRERFGEHVRAIVEACTDTIDPTGGRGAADWQQRKRDYISRLAHEPPETLIVSLADKLYNADAIRRDYIALGEELWRRFSANREEVLWYYRSLADRFNELEATRGTPMAVELTSVVADLQARMGERR